MADQMKKGEKKKEVKDKAPATIAAATTVTTHRTWPVAIAALALGFFVGQVCETDYVFIFRDASLENDLTPGFIEATCDASGLAPLPSLLDTRSWVYDELSPAETRTIAKFVAKQLDVKPSMAGGRTTGNALSGTESVVLIPPDKAAARAYVDGKTDEPPPRYAKVAVVRGLASPPDVMLYRVGPLPIDPIAFSGDSPDLVLDDSITSIEPLTSPGEIPYAKRPFDVNDDTSLLLAIPELQKILPFLVDFIGPVWDWLPGCPAGSNCWDPAAGRSLLVPYNDITSSATSRISRFSLNWYQSGDNVQAQWLHELPLAFRTNQTGSDPAEWFVYDFIYCGSLRTYASASDLLQAWQEKTLPTCPFDKSSVDPKQNGGPGNFDIPGLAATDKARPGSTLDPPRQSCSRRRFKLGGERGGNNGRLVSFLGWTFFATVRPATGLALMDIRFKGKRVAHEIALSEAVAYYSGSGTDQVMYLDSAWSMTQLSGGLIPGVDW